MKRKSRLSRQEEGAALLARLIDWGHQPELTPNIPHLFARACNTTLPVTLYNPQYRYTHRKHLLNIACANMAGRFVRASKYREHRHCMHEIKLTWRLGHVFGKSTRKEACYDNLHISRNAWDTNLVKVGHLAFTHSSKKLIANPGKS